MKQKKTQELPVDIFFPGRIPFFLLVPTSSYHFFNGICTVTNHKVLITNLTNSTSKKSPTPMTDPCIVDHIGIFYPPIFTNLEPLNDPCFDWNFGLVLEGFPAKI